jgi:hypothetical protein
LQAEIDGSQAGDQDALDLAAMDASAASGRQLQSFVTAFERPVESACVPRGAPRCEA